MKSNPLTAKGSESRARSRDASLSRGARLPTTRRATMRLLGAFAALLFLAPLAIGEALGSECESQYRMSHSDSDCMHAWWDNSPSWSCWGTKGGAESFCSNYGTVVVKVDIQGGEDLTPHRTTAGKWRYTRCLNDTNSISCCIDKSDLCVKNQVEPDSDQKIKYFQSGNSTLQTASVGTRIERYNFCQDNPDTIYCEINPRNDALWAPNCGDHDCTVGDCNWHWNQSDASDSCTLVSMNYIGADFFSPKCNVHARCSSSDTSQEVHSALTAEMWDVDDLEVCDDLYVKVSCD